MKISATSRVVFSLFEPNHSFRRALFLKLDRFLSLFFICDQRKQHYSCKHNLSLKIPNYYQSLKQLLLPKTLVLTEKSNANLH